MVITYIHHCTITWLSGLSRRVDNTMAFKANSTEFQFQSVDFIMFYKNSSDQSFVMDFTGQRVNQLNEALCHMLLNGKFSE